MDVYLAHTPVQEDPGILNVRLELHLLVRVKTNR